MDELLAPLPPARWPEALAPMRESFASRLAVYGAMAHHPPLLLAWAPLRDHVVTRTALGSIRAEVVILRLARHWRCDYERAHHVARARAAGMAAARVDALCGDLAGVWDEDHGLAAAVDGLLAEGRLDPATLTALAGELGGAGIFDLFATIGLYTTLALVANTGAVPIDAPAPAEATGA